MYIYSTTNADGKSCEAAAVAAVRGPRKAAEACSLALYVSHSFSLRARYDVATATTAAAVCLS